jgi:hypothetical protein
MLNINKIIDEFKKLDLATYPKDEIIKLISQVGNIGYVMITLHRGKSLMRARPNYNNERFEKKDDYSFKPAKYNTTYQRASTRNQTMFYATTIPENIEPGELDNMRVIGISEAIPLMRDKTKSGYQKISFGRWYVNEDIHLIAIVHKDKYFDESSYTRELVNGYKNFIKSAPDDVIEKSLQFQTFLADEFAKEEINSDYDYIISALFTELVIKKGFDGVLYPSVRTGGRGFNVAITPEATKKLGLYVAGECSIYKLRDHTVVGNDAIVELKGVEEEFKLVDLGSDQMECLHRLGVKSIDDLK